MDRLSFLYQKLKRTQTLSKSSRRNDYFVDWKFIFTQINYFRSVYKSFMYFFLYKFKYVKTMYI